MEINNITDELNKLLNDAPGIDGVTATIKANSPTTVINLYESDNQECYHQILGCALLLKGFGNRKGLKFNNITYSVPEIADMDNIRKGSLIYIRDNQIMEVIGILDGMLNLMTDPSHQIISKELADKIIDRVIVSSFSNVLTICDKIDFKGTDKFPFGLFVKVLKKRVTKKISLSSDPMYFKLYDRTSKLCNDAKIFNINKQQLFENYLDDLKTKMVAE